MLSIFKVQGNSMLPYIAAGDFVIVSRLFLNIKPGDCVIANHPNYHRIIKRIDKVCPDRGYWLTGENKESVSSEKMGWISQQQISAKVIKIIRG